MNALESIAAYVREHGTRSRQYVELEGEFALVNECVRLGPLKLAEDEDGTILWCNRYRKTPVILLDTIADGSEEE